MNTHQVFVARGDHPNSWKKSSENAYIPARKYYIHKFCFGIDFPKNYMSVIRNISLELISPKLHITYSSVIQRITWKSVWELFSWKASFHLPSRPKLLQKNSLQRKCFGAINFVKITKESLYKANSLACFLAKIDTPVAATLQRKSSGGIIFVIITKIITKENVPRNYFVIISASMVHEIMFSE